MSTTAMTFPERPLRGIALHALLQLAALVLLAAVLRAAIGAEDLVRSAELLTLAGAVTLAACALLSLRAVSATTAARATLGSAALAALAMLALALATGDFGRGALALAAGAFLLVGSFGLTLALVAATLRDRLTAATLLIAVGALAAAAPLWLGPIAERFAPTGTLVDTIVAVSPLTYLAVLADHDYLRATWFYEHSVLGSLRYDYPTVVSQSVVYALPFAAAAALRLPHFSQSRFAKELFR
jgi:hypothetical protein